MSANQQMMMSYGDLGVGSAMEAQTSLVAVMEPLGHASVEGATSLAAVMEPLEFNGGPSVEGQTALVIVMS